MSHRFLLWLLPCWLWLLTTTAHAFDPPPSFQERWKLELLPEKVPQIGELLPGTQWVQQTPKSILGQGLDYKVRFPAPDEKGQRRELHFTSISYPSVNAREAGIVETTHKFPLVVVGPCLQYGGLVKTAFVVPGERLVLDAVVRVDERRWYLLGSRKLDRKMGVRDDVEIQEFVFEFEEDPLVRDEGKLTVARHTRQLAQPKGETLQIPATYTLERRATDGPKVRKLKLLAEVVQRVRHNLPDLVFVGSPDFALLDDNRASPYGSGIFRAEKPK